jgi:serine/threonine protein phosphatase PrpC
VNGIMEVSRSIGDSILKKSGVICTPEIQRITLCGRDEFLLLACDGLW